jgi:phosphinothricin acetyltransferase
MTADLTIRRATAQDAHAIAAIYNHYIATSTATFDVEPKTAEERESWLSCRDARHPVLVAVRDGEIVGWGSLSRFRDRHAWRHTVEVGVYLAEGMTGRGIGGLLLERLIEAAGEAGHRALIAMVVADNGPSLRLFERGGFERVGTMREVGYKFGRWLDLAVLEMLLPAPEGTS